MIKFKADNLIGLGLSECNLKKLKEGKPITVNMSEMGFPDMKIMIFYGETEEKMQQDLAKFITPETKYSSTIDN